MELSDALLCQVHRWLLYALILVLIVLVWRSKYGLLYEDGNLSLGRIWGWIAFGIATFFWIRHAMGIIPPGTEFPPGLQEILYALLAYNLFKHSKGVVERIADVWSSRKFGRGIERADSFTDPTLGRWSEPGPPPRFDSSPPINPPVAGDEGELRPSSGIKGDRDG